jgi:peptidoglycan/xylan/chitin deacetylase (PgdA/CDA1 family)
VRFWRQGSITRVRTDDPVVALTFDDGPDPDCTPQLLDVLERHGARATFFMVGEPAIRHSELVRRVAEGGHAIGNHSWDHPSFHHLSQRLRWWQIRACHQALAPYGQRIFRPPYGHENRALRLEALALGYQVVTWSLDSGDWQDSNAASVCDRLIRGIRPGAIVLMHDGIGDGRRPPRPSGTPRPTLRAVARCLELFDGQLRFVTVPEILTHGRALRRQRQPLGRSE